MINQSGVFGVTLLEETQREISERFAGRTPDDGDRFDKLEVFKIATGSPFLTGGMAFFDCRVKKTMIIGAHTVFFGEVIAAKLASGKRPLVYYNQHYHDIGRKMNSEKGGS